MKAGAAAPRPSTFNLHPSSNALATWLLWAAALLLLAGYLLTYLAHAWALIVFPFAVDQGEGYDAYSGWLINLGRWIYTDNSAFPYYSSNYPPVYSYLISIPMAWLGPSLGAARAVSVASALGAGALIGWLVWRGRASWVASGCAILLFFASNYVFHSTPLARVNATMLLLSLAALLVLERARGWGLVAAGGLFLAALFTKQTAVDAVAAGLLWLVLARRYREALVLGAGVVGIGLAVVGALESLSGGHFWLNVVVGNVNPWDLEQLVAYYRNFLWLHLVVVALAAVQTLRELRARAPSLIGVYCATAGILAIGVGKWGAGESYFLPLTAAACVQAGRLVATLRWPGRAPALVGLLLVLQAGLFAHGPVAALFPGRTDSGFQATALGWQPGSAETAAGERLASYAQRFGGSVLAEEPGFLLVAGKPVIGNATHLRNLWQAGVWDESGLVNDILSRRYDFVVLDAQLYPPPVLDAIGRHYYLHDQVEQPQRRYLVFAPGHK